MLIKTGSSCSGMVSELLSKQEAGRTYVNTVGPWSAVEYLGCHRKASRKSIGTAKHDVIVMLIEHHDNGLRYQNTPHRHSYIIQQHQDLIRAIQYSLKFRKAKQNNLHRIIFLPINIYVNSDH